MRRNIAAVARQETARRGVRVKTPVEVFLAVADSGGKLGIDGDRLRMLLPEDCPLELKAAIRQHKPALLELLRLDFLVVDSDALKTTVIWTPDEATKEALIAAGAKPGSIYAAPELEQLVHGRITVDELRAIHAAKQGFDGKRQNRKRKLRHHIARQISGWRTAVNWPNGRWQLALICML
jgi:hypothetical protein